MYRRVWGGLGRGGAVLFFSFFLSLETTLTQRKARSLTCDPRWEGLPKLLFTEEWRCLFLWTNTPEICWPLFLLHVAKSSKAFSPDVCLSHLFPCTWELCSRCLCVRVKALKVTRNEEKHPWNAFRGGNHLKKGAVRGGVPLNRRYLLRLYEIVCKGNKAAVTVMSVVL